MINALTIKAAESVALDLDERGEKWGAQTIAGLLVIIEDLRKRLPDGV